MPIPLPTLPTLLVLVSLLAGCPKRGDEGEVDRVAPFLDQADAAWEARGTGGFAPVQEALDQAFALAPDDPRVSWRLSRLEVGTGMAAEDPREVVRAYARARTIGLDCLDLGTVLQEATGEGPEEAEQIVDRISGSEAECLAWTTFAWVRWLDAFGAEAAALDLAAIDQLMAREAEIPADPALFDWTRGLLAAVRPVGEGQDLDAARGWLEQTIAARPGELTARADLVWRVGVPKRDSGLVEAQLQAIEAVVPSTPEDQRAATRIAALRGRTERFTPE